MGAIYLLGGDSAHHAQDNEVLVLLIYLLSGDSAHHTHEASQRCCIVEYVTYLGSTMIPNSMTTPILYIDNMYELFCLFYSTGYSLVDETYLSSAKITFTFRGLTL